LELQKQLAEIKKQLGGLKWLVKKKFFIKC
jgi:hypothetical protein